MDNNLIKYNDIGQCTKLELQALVQVINSPECYQYKTNHLTSFDADTYNEEKALIAAGFNTVVEISAFRTFKQTKDAYTQLELQYTNHKKQISNLEEKIYITYKKYITAKNMLNNTFDITDDDTILISTHIADKKGNSLYDSLYKDYTNYKNILVSLINEKKKLDINTEKIYNSYVAQTKYLNIILDMWSNMLKC